MKVKLVKAGDKYGVKISTFFTEEYVDLVQPCYRWGKDSRFYLFCFGTKERAEEIFHMFTPKEVTPPNVKI